MSKECQKLTVVQMAYATHSQTLRASDSDSDISLRFRFGQQQQVNHLCLALNTRMKTIRDSLDIDCITGLDTGDN